MGKVEGYAVNSHAGPTRPINSDRVCIVGNMDKAGMRGKQISFFGVYSGENGVGKAEFYRDNFHVGLCRDQHFMSDMRSAAKSTIAKMDNIFGINHKGSLSSVSFILCVITHDFIYFIQLGQPTAFLSSKLG
jgi:hypothetical protein